MGSDQLRHEVEAVIARLERVRAAGTTLASLIHDNGDGAHVPVRNVSAALGVLDRDLALAREAVDRAMSA